MGTFDIEIGTKVKWNDPAIEEFKGKQRELQKSRIYKIVDIINEDMVLIADEYGEVETYVNELSFVQS